jgi:SAM-dependent methyltransferase
LRPIIEAICVDGRLKDGALACVACGEVVATVADFRADFLGARRVVPDDPPTPLVLPVLGEWRVAPVRPELDIDGAWITSPPYLASDGSAGDRLTFTSHFTDLVARCARTPEGGRLAVFVDGERKHTVDLADGGATHVVGIPLVTNAPDRLHTVELLTLGGENHGSRRGQVLVEELIVRGPIEADRPFRVPTPINRGNAYSPALEALLARLEPGAPVLEIGGGDRRRAVAGHLNVEYLPFELADMYADIHHLPFRDEAFELACSQAVFEHVARPFDAARELVRVTRPGGVIFTEVAFLQPVHAVPHHYFNMTAAGVRELFHECEVIDEGWFGPLSSTVEWLVQAAGLGGKVRPSRLRKIVSDLRQLDPLVSEADLRAVASGVHVTVRTPQR